MLTFTQNGYALTCDDVSIGAEYSDIECMVTLSDSLFDGYDYVGLYTARPGDSQVWMAEIGQDGKTKIPHQALTETHDVYVSVGAYKLQDGARQQMTTQAISLQVLHSNNPSGLQGDDTDWKDAVGDMIVIGSAGVRVIDNLLSTLDNAALAANQGRVLAGMIKDVDAVPTKGSAKPVSSGGVYDILDGITTCETAETNISRIGSLMVVAGSTTINGVSVTDTAGGVYQGSAGYSTSTNKKSTDFEITSAFPACFSKLLYSSIELTGSSATAWKSRTRAHRGGFTDILFTRGSKINSASNFSVRYFAVGRIDGGDAAGAEVVSQLLPLVGKQYGPDGMTAIGEYLCDLYDDYVGNAERDNSDTAWCSEAASVAAAKVGIPESIFPRFASAYKGSKAFSDLGRWYKRTGTGTNSTFTSATVTNIGTASQDHEDFTYAIGAGTAVPDVGSVLFMGSSKHPSHTALVVHVSRDDTSYKIYTVEGNMTLYDSDGSALYSCVQLRCRDIYSSSALGDNVFAMAKPDYPVDWFKTAANATSQLANGEEMRF